VARSWTIFCILVLGGGAAAPVCPGATTAPAIDRQRLEQLDERAAALIKAGKLDEAEALLQQALSIAPRYHRSLYNMAVIEARHGRSSQAMEHLQRAAEEGFTDFIGMQADSNLASLRGLDRYKQLIASKDKIQLADAQRTLLILQRQFGQGYLYEIDERHKLIFAVNTDAPTLEALRRQLALQIVSLCGEVFSRKPDQYIIFILPTAQRFAAMARPGVGGGYDHAKHVLIVQRLGQLVAHEFTHALHNADLDGADQSHPAWLSEGLATMYEGAIPSEGRLLPGDNYRLSDVQRAAATGELIPLARLLLFDEEAFHRAATKAYGQSGSLLLYLHERGLLRRFYETFKEDYAKDKTGRLALEQVSGMKLAELDRRWIAWMIARQAPFQMTGDRAVLGIQFGEAHDGLPVASVERNSPAERAGLKRGDVIVGIDGMPAWDAYTMLTMLQRPGSEGRILLRIRRGAAYLDVPVNLGRL